MVIPALQFSGSVLFSRQTWSVRTWLSLLTRTSTTTCCSKRRSHSTYGFRSRSWDSWARRTSPNVMGPCTRTLGTWFVESLAQRTSGWWCSMTCRVPWRRLLAPGTTDKALNSNQPSQVYVCVHGYIFIYTSTILLMAFIYPSIYYLRADDIWYCCQMDDRLRGVGFIRGSVEKFWCVQPRTIVLSTLYPWNSVLQMYAGIYRFIMCWWIIDWLMWIWF